jgi:hypothetical protein
VLSAVPPNKIQVPIRARGLLKLDHSIGTLLSYHASVAGYSRKPCVTTRGRQGEVLLVLHRLFLNLVGRNPGLLNSNEAVADCASDFGSGDQIYAVVPIPPKIYEDPCISIPARERFDVVRKLSLSILLGP